MYTVSEDEQNQSTAGGEWKGEKGRIDRAMLTKHLIINELETQYSIYAVLRPCQKQCRICYKVLNSQGPKKTEEFTGY